jgi:hypothetical protein
MGMCLVERDLGHGDGELAALRHRVACVHRQIHDHLLQLPAIGAHRHREIVAVALELDVLADQSAQHAVHLLDHRVHVQHLEREHVAPPEG